MSSAMASQEQQPLSLAEYASAIEKNGTRVVHGKEVFWVQYERGSMMRVPTFWLEPPASEEIRQVLHKGRALVAGYIIEPDERHPANSWLYICTDPSYSLSNLKSAGRRDARRGLRGLKIRPLTLEEVIDHGVRAFCDTRQRNGLSDGTPEEFTRRFISRAAIPCYAFLGAWRDDKLAAFLSVMEVDDWAEIDGSFSMDAYLNLCPNDSLVYSALHYYLIEKKYRVLSYGLSSLQAESNEMGLHAFKSKVGFEAKPVHRVFALHPLMKPFANKLTLSLLKIALFFRPGDRRLKKASGVLEVILGSSDQGIDGKPLFLFL